MSNVILWFRRDLRLADNPALQYAVEQGHRILPLFIWEPDEDSDWTPGAASRWWLHHSLVHLQHQLRRLGADLIIQSGDPAQILAQLGKQYAIDEILWNRLYEPHQVVRDGNLKTTLIDTGIVARSFNARLLIEPWQLLKGDGGPYRVFTPFWKMLQRLYVESRPKAAPTSLNAISVADTDNLPIDALRLLPDKPWDEGLYSHWRPGEIGAHARLHAALDGALIDYTTGRDHPGHAGTSRLSPHLHFGELGPRQVWFAVRAWAAGNSGPGYVEAADSFLRQLGWREFAIHLLYHFPHTADAPLDARFNHMPWSTDAGTALRAWQTGRTGIPIVDAGMRELWQTGWMHNRVRMLVASLLTKNLRIHWLEGARWFWDTLVDADLANNTLGWQWVAGCGADASPYFRIFNPVVQGERFDPKGDYVRQWVPELRALPEKWIHQPAAAPANVLAEANIELGRDYPLPIVDLKTSREDILRLWDIIKRQPRE
ncbi:MAG: DNA photolyase family protein [Gammaproteobacteria bacterium]|nr:DNA photolyase family protein [Gammaproteobacteria bacterium]MBU2478953.1 DNA photolyase family protein [Gammaproteobacteria bacterium]